MAGKVTMLIWLGKQLLSQTDRQEVRTINKAEFDVMMNTLISAARRGREAGDEEATQAAIRVLQRIVDGEDPSTVYSEWLRSQPQPR